MSESANQQQRVRIVTDSLAWLPSDLIQEHAIRVVPLHVHIGNEQFTETVDITNREFYRRLREEKILPKTSQPAAGEFLAAYTELADEADAILSIHATSKLSGTYRSAETAAGMLREERSNVRVETLDTLQIASCQGIVVLRAAEQAAQGVPFEQIVANTRELMTKPRLLLVVETLEYLQKGGRIGRAQALIGGLLHIRPILTLVDGEVAPKERARTRAKAIERLLDLMAEYAQGRPFGHVGVLHADAPDVAEQLASAVKARFTIHRFIQSEIGPVIGTYVGPGAFAVTYHCD